MQSLQSTTTNSLNTLNFINLAYNSLPIEENPDNQPHKVRGHYYSKVQPKQRKNPKIISLSETALNLLDLTKDQVLSNENESAQILSGNIIPSNAKPIAHCYCGHQFGSWAGQLGDGRAISYGDIKNNKGEIVELQLKGSGMTPYSRFADGNAVLRSSIREYLCSEAMHYLNIPTTRAASLIITDDQAARDPLYNSNVIYEKCAIVLRLAPSFIRFGSFQVCNEGGPSEGLGEQMIPELLDFVIKNHYPEYEGKENKYMLFFQEITKRTAELVAKWQSVGFCHGVLNTDNMSINGVTIDYGPFGFMEHFDKKYACNHSDKEGYYAYENQPSSCKWNLLRLAEGMKFIFDNADKTDNSEDKSDKTDRSQILKDYVINNYDNIYYNHYYYLMRQKLGLFNNNLYEKNLSQDKLLINNLFSFMNDAGSEFTNLFRKLNSYQLDISANSIDENGNAILNQYDNSFIQDILKLSPSPQIIIERNKPLFDEVQLMQIKKIQQTNPMILAMKGITPKLIQEQEEKLERYYEMKDMTQDEFNEINESSLKVFMKKYKKRLYEEYMQSKEGENNNNTIEQFNKERKEQMDKINPSIVLRNYMAQQVIEQAEKGDYTGIDKLLELLKQPFQDIVNNDNAENNDNLKICQITPNWAKKLCVSCSS